jgi:hypothetical protein
MCAFGGNWGNPHADEGLAFLTAQASLKEQWWSRRVANVA